MKNKYLLILFGFGCLAYFTFIYFNIKIRKQDYAIFFSTKLEGKLVYKYGSSGGERLTLDNSSQEFIFWSNPSSLNNYDTFSHAAEIGDSVIKPAYSDTLLLIKRSGKRYKYTFKKSYKLVIK